MEPKNYILYRNKYVEITYLASEPKIGYEIALIFGRHLFYFLFGFGLGHMVMKDE